MTWTIVFSSKARKDLLKIPTNEQRRIIGFLHDRIAPSIDPRQLGAALSGPLAGHWKYRVGDYRVVAQIEDRTVTILIVRIGNRRDVYR